MNRITLMTGTPRFGQIRITGLNNTPGNIVSIMRHIRKRLIDNGAEQDLETTTQTDLDIAFSEDPDHWYIRPVFKQNNKVVLEGEQTRVGITNRETTHTAGKLANNYVKFAQQYGLLPRNKKYHCGEKKE